MNQKEDLEKRFEMFYSKGYQTLTTKDLEELNKHHVDITKNLQDYDLIYGSAQPYQLSD